MRVWDIPPAELCHKHLLGEHRELHGLWNIIIEGKTGYSRHPETLRWVGKQKALFNRHETLVSEMKQRGYKHNTPLDSTHANGEAKQDSFINTLEEQRHILTMKPCECYR